MSNKRILITPSSTLRDKSRQTDAKLACQSRRQERRAKSARLFLAFAFPAELAV